MRFFDSPGVFDGLVNVFVMELHKSPIRPHLCDVNQRKKVVKTIVEYVFDYFTEKGMKPHDFAEIPQHIRCLRINLAKADLSSEL